MKGDGRLLAIVDDAFDPSGVAVDLDGIGLREFSPRSDASKIGAKNGQHRTLILGKSAIDKLIVNRRLFAQARDGETLPNERLPELGEAFANSDFLQLCELAHGITKGPGKPLSCQGLHKEVEV